jgi:hypothetical protein
MNLLDLILGSQGNNLGPDEGMMGPQPAMPMRGGTSFFDGFPNPAITKAPATFDQRFGPMPPQPSMDDEAALPPNARPMSGEGLPGIPIINPPMPRPRPVEAPSGDMTGAPAGMPTLPPVNGPQGRGAGLMDAILGNKDLMRRVSAGLAGGLSSVGTQPFAGQAFANGAGGALTGINKSDDTDQKQKLETLDRALKLRQIDQLGSYRDDMTDVKYGDLDVKKQKADQTGDYQKGRLAIGERGVAVKEGEAPSRIALNNSRIDLNGSRVAGADRTSLMQADAQADRWRAETGKTLRQAKQAIMQDYSLRPEQKQAQLAAVDQKLQDADNQYFDMKKQNRLSRGLDEDGKPAPKAAARKPASASGSEISMGGDGTQAAPYKPQSESDYGQIEPGSYYMREDGSLMRKK